MKKENLEGNKTLLKLDASKAGQLAIWKVYEHAALDKLLKYDELTSTQVWELVKLSGIQISRASVIFFLNRLVDSGLASYRNTTGKGGVHRVYKVIDRTWLDWDATILDMFLLKLGEIFPDQERIKEINKYAREKELEK